MISQSMAMPSMTIQGGGHVFVLVDPFRLQGGDADNICTDITRDLFYLGGMLCRASLAGDGSDVDQRRVEDLLPVRPRRVGSLIAVVTVKPLLLRAMGNPFWVLMPINRRRPPAGGGFSDAIDGIAGNLGHQRHLIGLGGERPS